MAILAGVAPEEAVAWVKEKENFSRDAMEGTTEQEVWVVNDFPKLLRRDSRTTPTKQETTSCT